jgi:acyl-homoserine-lactone acylase
MQGLPSECIQSNNYSMPLTSSFNISFPLKKILLATIIGATLLSPIRLPAQAGAERRWKERSVRTTIIRDQWGIPHVYGKTDADAVFGLMYAQCEDDFPRIEMNYIEKLGRLSEVNGPKDIWNDLYLRMIIDSSDAIRDYQKSPAWLKELLQAWSDGIEYFLYKHPNVKPALLQKFPPWYPLLWTDGSIGAINTGNLTAQDVRLFYSSGTRAETDLSWELGAVIQTQKELSGSNGFAIAPSRSASGHAMLYINPHVTFYFRPEVQMSSDEGLSAYGAVTWGQFFIYQGFNEHGGWMHTSGNMDVADEYEETILVENGKRFYRHEGKLKPVTERKIRIRYLDSSGMRQREFTAFSTHHGPVMAKKGDQWISVRHYNRALNSLEQSWLRTKTAGLKDYQKVMDMRGNTSNNTVYADREGNIAYWHGNYMPRRDSRYDWSKAVDGSVLSTEYQGLHDVKETVHVINPSTGWIQNCNSTPFTVSGKASPLLKNYPAYMAPDGENFRGVSAIRQLDGNNKLTMDSLIRIGYNTYLPAFAVLLPALIQSFDKNVPRDNQLYQEIHEAIDSLRSWDHHAASGSIATTLAVEWAQKLNPVIQNIYIDPGKNDQVAATRLFAERAGPDDLLLPLRWVVRDLGERFGTWRMPWGEVNRFQRLTGSIKQVYDDAKPSLPVPFAASTWGCLPAFASRRMEGTQKRYGFGGNSFICVVEFGPRIRAKSLLAGGNNSQPDSPHFSDQAERYTRGAFKDVLFYRGDVEKNAKRVYRPGE